MRKNLKVAFCGGGTGGHYYPAIAVYQELSKRFDIEALYFTIAGRLDDKNVEKDIPRVKRIPLKVKGLRRPLAHPENFFRVLSHLRTSSKVKKILKDFNPDLVFSTGGYISYPVVKAAHTLGIPIYIHEQNSIPGIANKKLSVFARKVYVSFSESADYFPVPKDKIIVSGNPVRKPVKNREELLNQLGFDPKTPFVVITGGSLGSDLLNELALSLYSKILEHGPNINFLHITGNENIPAKLNEFPFVIEKAYEPELHEYINIADAVIARGGATTIAEILNYKSFGIIIPWEGAAENHQYYNAVSLEKQGQGCVILESAATPEKIYSTLVTTLKRMSFKNNEVFRNPARVIVEHVVREE